MSPPGDHMFPPNHSPATDIEADLEPVIIHEDSSPSTPSADKLPQAKSLQVPVHTASEPRWVTCIFCCIGLTSGVH